LRKVLGDALQGLRRRRGRAQSTSAVYNASITATRIQSKRAKACNTLQPVQCLDAVTARAYLACMPKSILPMLAAYLWDLRSQCEAQVRELTDAQRKLDAVRDNDQPGAQRSAVERLQLDLKKVRAANAEIREAVKAALEQTDEALSRLTSRKER
jgi:hypothetical protein